MFGPVLAVLPFDNEEDAIRLANGTEFGLMAGIWSTQRLARHPRRPQGEGGAGLCERLWRRRRHRVPFGGMKKSGHGREKGFEALYEFSTLKTLIIKHD